MTINIPVIGTYRDNPETGECEIMTQDGWVRFWHNPPRISEATVEQLSNEIESRGFTVTLSKKKD